MFRIIAKALPRSWRRKGIGPDEKKQPSIIINGVAVCPFVEKYIPKLEPNTFSAMTLDDRMTLTKELLKESKTVPDSFEGKDLLIGSILKLMNLIEYKTGNDIIKQLLDILKVLFQSNTKDRRDRSQEKLETEVYEGTGSRNKAGDEMRWFHVITIFIDATFQRLIRSLKTKTHKDQIEIWISLCVDWCELIIQFFNYCESLPDVLVDASLLNNIFEIHHHLHDAATDEIAQIQSIRNSHRSLVCQYCEFIGTDTQKLNLFFSLKESKYVLQYFNLVGSDQQASNFDELNGFKRLLSHVDYKGMEPHVIIPLLLLVAKLLSRNLAPAANNAIQSEIVDEKLLAVWSSLVESMSKLVLLADTNGILDEFKSGFKQEFPFQSSHLVDIAYLYPGLTAPEVRRWAKYDSLYVAWVIVMKSRTLNILARQTGDSPCDQMLIKSLLQIQSYYPPSMPVLLWAIEHYCMEGGKTELNFGLEFLRHVLDHNNNHVMNPGISNNSHLGSHPGDELVPKLLPIISRNEFIDEETGDNLFTFFVALVKLNDQNAESVAEEMVSKLANKQDTDGDMIHSIIRCMDEKMLKESSEFSLTWQKAFIHRGFIGTCVQFDCGACDPPSLGHMYRSLAHVLGYMLKHPKLCEEYSDQLEMAYERMFEKLDTQEEKSMELFLALKLLSQIRKIGIIKSKREWNLTEVVTKATDVLPQYCEMENAEMSFKACVAVAFVLREVLDNIPKLEVESAMNNVPDISRIWPPFVYILADTLMKNDMITSTEILTLVADLIQYENAIKGLDETFINELGEVVWSWVRCLTTMLSTMAAVKILGSVLPALRALYGLITINEHIGEVIRSEPANSNIWVRFVEFAVIQLTRRVDNHDASRQVLFFVAASMYLLYHNLTPIQLQVILETHLQSRFLKLVSNYLVSLLDAIEKFGMHEPGVLMLLGNCFVLAQAAVASESRKTVEQIRQMIPILLQLESKLCNSSNSSKDLMNGLGEGLRLSIAELLHVIPRVKADELSSQARIILRSSVHSGLITQSTLEYLQQQRFPDQNPVAPLPVKRIEEEYVAAVVDMEYSNPELKVEMEASKFARDFLRKKYQKLNPNAEVKPPEPDENMYDTNVRFYGGLVDDIEASDRYRGLLGNMIKASSNHRYIDEVLNRS